MRSDLLHQTISPNLPALLCDPRHLSHGRTLFFERGNVACRVPQQRSLFSRNSWPGTLSILVISVEEQFYLFGRLSFAFQQAITRRCLVRCNYWHNGSFRTLTLSESKLWTVLPFMNLDSLGAGALLAIYGLKFEVQKFMEQRWIIISCFVAMELLRC